MGNRHEHMSPHGCYPCRGDDEWVTIAVRDDADWHAFCQVLDQPSLAEDPRFAEARTRYHHQEELDAVISGWTSSRDQYQVMEALQNRGVPAGPVLNARALLADPHFRNRGFLEEVDHPPETGLGRREYIGRGWKMSQGEIPPKGPAPMLGEGNDYVWRRVLGLPPEEIDLLKREGAIGYHPTGGQPPSTVSLERQLDLGWIVGYDPLPRESPGMGDGR